MSGPARATRSLVGRFVGERGFTLVELLLVMALSIVVVGGPLAFIITSIDQQNASSSRVAAVEQASAGLAQLTRDIREVVPGTTSTFTWGGTSASASMTLPVPGSDGASTETVAWTCSFASLPGTCTRTVNAGTAVTELANVDSVAFSALSDQGGTLSSPASNPSYVGITMKVLDISQLDAGATHTVTGVRNPITLQDGVDLRANT